jgi:hypothetical protein
MSSVLSPGRGRGQETNGEEGIRGRRNKQIQKESSKRVVQRRKKVMKIAVKSGKKKRQTGNKPLKRRKEKRKGQ